MQKWLVTILIAALIVPAGLKVAVLFHYVLEYDDYVTVLCENRDKPELKCNGQCHLAKELKTVQEPVNPTDAKPIPSQLQAELVFLVPSIQKQVLHAAATPSAHWADFDEAMIRALSANVPVPPPEFIV